ncbi:MAG TPA: YihY/virulence factor BrkB family protein [Bacillota bacterium]|nr:YihY/virulence factor BrkB family protein [Bacillota bacterium]
MDAEKVAGFLKQLYQRVVSEDVFGLAAQLAYFFLLSLFPFLLFLLTLIGYLPLDLDNITAFIETYAPPEIMEWVMTNIQQLAKRQNSGLLSISIIGTLWSASKGINALMRAFNRAYGVEEDRSFIVSRLIAIILTIAMVVIISVAFLLPIFGKTIGLYIFSFVGLSEDFLATWDTLRWAVSSVVFFIVFLALYVLSPNQHICLQHAVWGAIFTTVSWQLVSLAFSYYVSAIGNYSATYGSLGTIIVLMIWFYISGVIIILGGFINAIVHTNRS